MKTVVSREVVVCDFCDVKEASQQCLGCGKDICYECQDKHGKQYPHSAVCGGSDDGMYCLACDERLRSNGDEFHYAHRELHAAYRGIESLRREWDGFAADFEKRRQAAEKRVQDARKACGLR